MMKHIKHIGFATLLIIAMTTAYGQNTREYKAPEFARTWSHPDEQPDHIVLNVTQDPAHSVSVTWRTDTTVTQGIAEIAIALPEPKFWRNAESLEAETEVMDGSGVETAEIKAHYHSVTFTGLMPDTLYAYRVGDGRHWSEWFQFRTASEKPEPFSFLYVGDAQNYILELWSRLIREGYRKDPDAALIIHAGDLINRAHDERDWHEWFRAGSWIHSTVQCLPVPGNHEYRSFRKDEPSQLSLQWRPQFTLPANGPEGLEETAYYLDYQGVRFVALNSNRDQEKQVAWLEKVLSENTQKWVIATFHHPLFSASAGRDNEKLRNLWKPVFDKYKVDLVLQGHDHSYARGRTEPLAASNVVDGVNLKDRTGPVYVVSVSGGKMYSLKPDGWEDYPAERDRAGENVQLVQHIQVSGDSLRYHSFTATGSVYDAFTIIKKKGEPNLFVEQQQRAIAALTHDNTIPYQDPEAFDFETSNLEQWEVSTNTESFSIVKRPVRRGHYAVQVTGSPRTKTIGAYLTDDSDARLGSTTWYGFSVYIDSKRPPKGKTILAKWTGSPDDDLEQSRPPALALALQKGGLKLEGNHQKQKSGGGQKVERIPFSALNPPVEKGEWIDLVFQVKWSFHENGIVTVWKNGKKLLSYEGPVGYNDKDGPILHLGTNAGDGVLYFDEYRRGGSFEDVNPSNEVRQVMIR